MSQPGRVVTVTINPAIDQTVAIPNFTPGSVNRVLSSQLTAGGKGINVASFLSDFGLSATVTGFLGTGNDEIFRNHFASKGIADRCVRIPGDTRIGVKIVDSEQQQTTDINFPGQTPSPDEIEQLFNILRQLAASNGWFVLSGSIPAGVSGDIYRRMVQTLAGKTVVLDTSGEGLRQAISAGPSLIKPNVAELAEYIGQKISSPGVIPDIARRLMQQYGIGSVVVSLGKDGAIFVEGDEQIWASPPPVEVKSTVGAGDAMVAGIVAGKIQGLALVDQARLATAFSMSAITHIGSGIPSIDAIQAGMDRVNIQTL